MRKQTLNICLLLCLFIGLSTGIQGIPCAGDKTEQKGRVVEYTDQWSGMLLDALANNKCTPVMAHNYLGIHQTDAYRVQKKVLLKRLKQDTIIGFKAGITSTGVQKRFGIDEPVAGVMLTHMKLTDGAQIELKDFKRPMLETEVGLVICQPITTPIKNVEQLKKHISHVLPLIEVPDLCFDKPKQMKVEDIIAANVSATAFIVGKKQPLAEIDPDAVTVTLLRDKETVNTGKGTDCLGSQWQAALWLVNRMTAMGFELKPGHILLTGAMGKMIPAKPGSYKADYGTLGTVSFSIK